MPPEVLAAKKKHAVHRGLHFIHATSLDDRNFDEWVADYLWCFYSISASAADPDLRQLARQFGLHAAHRWRGGQPSDTSVDDAGHVAYLVSVIDSARRFGLWDDGVWRQICDNLGRFTARQYLGFDPAVEPPPADIPAPCESCHSVSARGAASCSTCGATLIFRSRYDIWSSALVLAYTGESLGTPLGSSHRTVLGWLPSMRPYRGAEGGANHEFADTVYAVTHLVYTINDYHRCRIAPASWPEEFEFLLSHLAYSMDIGDPDMLGELLDSLKAFGLPDSHPSIKSGIEYLLATQNADGSWGDPTDPVIYNRYHPSWAAVDGLRDYRWSHAKVPPFRYPGTMGHSFGV